MLREYNRILLLLLDDNLAWNDRDDLYSGRLENPVNPIKYSTSLFIILNYSCSIMSPDVLLTNLHSISVLFLVADAIMSK